MINPTRNKNYITKFCDFWFKRWWFTIVVKEIIYFGIPLILLRLVLNKTNADLIVFTVITWRLSIEILTNYFFKKCESLVLITTESAFVLIDQIVELTRQKDQSFISKLERIDINKNYLKTVFNQIEDPEEQIFLINKAIFETFSQVKSDAIHHSRIKVRIALMQDGEPIKWLAYQPQLDGIPKTNIKDLQGDSALTEATKNKSIHIVEDIEKVLKNRERGFKPTETITKGSLICYPIIRNNKGDVPLVISIYASEKKTFTVAHKESYEWLLGRFTGQLEIASRLIDFKTLINSKKGER